MPQKLLYSECKYGRLVAGQQPFEAVCPCCLTTMLIEACCQVDCGINADIYPLQTANNHFILFSSGVDITEQKRIQCKNQRNTAHSEQKYELAIQK